MQLLSSALASLMPASPGRERVFQHTQRSPEGAERAFDGLLRELAKVTAEGGSSPGLATTLPPGGKTLPEPVAGDAPLPGPAAPGLALPPRLPSPILPQPPAGPQPPAELQQPASLPTDTRAFGAPVRLEAPAPAELATEPQPPVALPATRIGTARGEEVPLRAPAAPPVITAASTATRGAADPSSAAPDALRALTTLESSALPRPAHTRAPELPAPGRHEGLQVSVDPAGPATLAPRTDGASVGLATVTTPATVPADSPAAPASPRGADVPTAVFDLETPMGRPEWSQSLGSRLTWMAEHAVGRAELRLHPQHLGPVEAQVSVTRDEVSVVFHAAHAATREALEAAIPRLREMMTESGLNLAQANVSYESPGQQRQSDGTLRSSATTDGAFADGDVSDPGETAVLRTARAGLVDEYA